MSKNNFIELFVYELNGILNAEHQILDALPNVIEAASSEELKMTLQNHYEETQHQTERLQKIFSLLNKESSRQACKAMRGLIEESDEIINRYSRSSIRDAALIAACQRIEHYEIAVYGTLKTFAKQLDFDEIADLLEETLAEEGGANEKLTDIAEGGFFTTRVNQTALQK